jgi:predicted DNA binding CopG/RHH family protein
MGRPPLAEGAKRSERVTVHLTSAEHEELEQRAAKRGVRVGEIAREILVRVLRRKGR